MVVSSYHVTKSRDSLCIKSPINASQAWYGHMGRFKDLVWGFLCSIVQEEGARGVNNNVTINVVYSVEPTAIPFINHDSLYV